MLFAIQLHLFIQFGYHLVNLLRNKELGVEDGIAYENCVRTIARVDPHSSVQAHRNFKRKQLAKAL